MSDEAPATGGQGGDWTAVLPEELRGYVQNKGWKDPADLANSYVNLEKLRGVPAERLLTLPEKSDDPKWGELWAKLGKPEKPEDYGIKAAEGGDPAFAAEAAKWLHDLNIPKAAGAGLVEKFTVFAAAQQAAEEARLTAEATKQENDLKAAWGSAYDQNVEIARRAAAQFGLTEEVLAGIEKSAGYRATMELFNNIGTGLGEADAVGMGGKAPGGNRLLTPEAARARIRSLMVDTDWANKYLNGNVEAREEMERLQKAAAV